MNSGVDSAANAVIGLLSFVLLVGIYAWVALALSALFRKLGEEPWRGWVPFLNIATVLKWGGFSPWLVLFSLIPGLGQLAVTVLVVMSAHKLNRGFGYGGGMTALAALLFPVWATIVGFGPAPWRGARPVAARPTLPPPTGASPPYAPFTSAPPAPWPGGLTTPPPAPHAAAVAPQSWAPPPPAGPVAPPPLPPAPTPVVGMPPGHEPTVPMPHPRSTPDWQAEVDEVSAISPAPFPPSAAPSAASAGASFVSPPVAAGDDAVISEVPGRGADAPVTRSPAPARHEPAAPSEPDPVDERNVFPELTGEVSAVVGSPAAGAPVSATRSVSAQHRDEAEATGDDLDDVDQTVMVRRRRAVWELVPPSGAPIPLEADVVILGRHPAAEPRHPRAQLVTIIDPTRTVSKTHARLERRGDAWHITDLDSTNGVLLPSLLGTDIELEPGTEVEVADRFLLGDAALRLQRVELGD
ncbi:DUF5684 domain-containing protein [Microbacterium dauci]|uniref:DUF5684 domain-containing protein n=1 Tax=Microbacterium dauci TaxID=3048008 RepID=A0ABT6ZDY8_9MICO|nr:DUF5684 domain-containing protein [Microbacterium sp. LX3-4]MDJ1114387.1 DUF5684 domain-containing protein [Microbacterium sp. LX3-4]